MNMKQVPVFSNNISGRMLGKLEAEIMKIIWESSGPISVADVVKILSQKRKIAYTTVMTIMGRLVEKNLLTRKMHGLSYFYQPKLSQEKFIAKSVHNIVITAISALGQEAIIHFVKEIKKISPQKRKALLKMLDK